MWVFHYLLKSTRLSLLSPASFHILIYIFRLFLFDRWCWDHMKDLKTEEKKMLFETYQWIGFYMITASVLKGLTNNFYGFSLRFPRHWSLKIDSLNWLVNLLTKTGHRRCSIKKGALKNFENSQENTCARVSFLIKLQASEMQLY